MQDRRGSFVKSWMLIAFLFAGGALWHCGGPKQTVQPPPQPPEPVTFDEPAPAPPREEPKPEAVKKNVTPPVPFVLQRIHFDFDKYELKPEAQRILAENARVLQAYPDVNIVIEGHCDERGTVEYNLALGDKRARAARDYLVALGISPSRISVISYGKERPLDYGHNEAAWAKNRRAEFVRR